MYIADQLVSDICPRTSLTFPRTISNTQEGFKNGTLLIFVSNILLQLGVPANIKGYSYLREAIIVKAKNPKIDMPVTKVLYPNIAKKYDTSEVRVERAIRHAITVAWNKIEWNRTGQSFHEKDFLFLLLNFDRRPTNSEFIAMIVECVTLFAHNTGNL